MTGAVVEGVRLREDKGWATRAYAWGASRGLEGGEEIDGAAFRR
jgi:hypothetical protein